MEGPRELTIAWHDVYTVCMSGKFQRTYSSVAWRMHGRFQRTYSSHREACPSSASSHEQLIHAPPHPSPPVHIFTYRQPQRSIFFLRKFTWTLMHAPPHPTPTQPFSCVACHLQGTLTCPTPPQPLKCIEKVKENHFLPRPCSSRCPTTWSYAMRTQVDGHAMPGENKKKYSTVHIQS